MAERKFYGMKNTICSRRFCKIKNTIELGKSVDSKDCVPAVKPVINNSEIVDMEIQVRNEYNWPERSLLYLSRAYDDL